RAALGSGRAPCAPPACSPPSRAGRRRPGGRRGGRALRRDRRRRRRPRGRSAYPEGSSRRMLAGMSALDLGWIRPQFPALSRLHDRRPVAYLDGPAGSQVPRRVADAVAGYLLGHNANTHGEFPSSRETDALLGAARQAAGDLLGAADAAEVVFGANATSLAFALSRSLARTW